MNLIKNFGLYALRSQWHAGILALVFALAPVFGIPFFGWISIIVIGLVTLRHGAAQGLLVLVWSALPSIALIFLSTDLLFLNQVLLGGAMVWLFALLLRAQYSWSHLLEIMAWFAVIAVLIMHAAMSDLYGWWGRELAHWVAQYNQALSSEGIELTITANALFYLTRIATGLLTAIVCLNTVFNLLLARWWQSLIYNPGGLSQEFLMIRLSYRLVMGLAIVAILLALKVHLALDVLPVFLVVFFVAGFSLVNVWMLRLKRAWIWMLLFYLLLIFQFVSIGPVVVVLAIVDSFIDIRQRFIIKKS